MQSVGFTHFFKIFIQVGDRGKTILILNTARLSRKNIHYLKWFRHRELHALLWNIILTLKCGVINPTMKTIVGTVLEIFALTN